MQEISVVKLPTHDHFLGKTRKVGCSLGQGENRDLEFLIFLEYLGSWNDAFILPSNLAALEA